MINQFNTLEVAGFLIAVLLVAVLGFVAGRLSHKNGNRDKIATLEQTLAEERAQSAAYREQVGAHFGHSAKLFADMTHSYKNFFDHLAQGYTALEVAETQGQPGFKEQMLALQPDAHLTLTGATAATIAASEDFDIHDTPVITEAQAVYGEHETKPKPEAENSTNAAQNDATPTASAPLPDSENTQEQTERVEDVEDTSASNHDPEIDSTAQTADADSEPHENTETQLGNEDFSGRREPGLRGEQ